MDKIGRLASASRKSQVRELAMVHSSRRSRGASRVVPERDSSVVNSIMRSNETTPQNFSIGEVAAAAQEETVAQARELLLEYGRFVVAQPGAARFCFGSLEKEAARFPQSYLEQGGGCLLAHVLGRPAGFVAWRALPGDVDANAWEMKRLWVRPVARGLRLGRALTQAVVDRAVAARRSAIYLDTAPASMGAAHRLYLELGFEPCAPYNDNPLEGLAWLRKQLDHGSRAHCE
jgi:ribosomal protein S18 acetylase RimI-like enzyme